MEARQRPLVEYMEGSEKNFIIPIYQRNYDWKKENCKQLFDDLEDMIEKKLDSHFFGSIVSKPELMGRVIIIDGQQRLTTVSLLLLALYNYINNNNLKDDERLDERIYEVYLINKWAKDNDKRMRLKTIKKDEEAYSKLFENDETKFVHDSTLTQNYLYLYKRIEESKLSAYELFSAISKLMIVDVQLEEKDNAQLVFESMNSTGLDLSEADKIRNFVLMDKTYDEQKELYEKYWNEIEKNVKYETTQFIKDYLTVELNSVPNANNIYKAFKEDLIFVKRDKDIKEILEEMYKYSIIYSKIKYNKFDDASINNYIEDINYIKYYLTYPFLMKVLWRYENSEMRTEDVVNLLKTLTSYLTRRIIAGKPSNALQKYFCIMDKDIMSRLSKQNLDMTMYDDVFAYIILNKQGSAEYVDDTEFVDCFKKFKLYKAQSPFKCYVLRTLENHYNKNNKLQYVAFEQENGLSIEHIMPQTLTKAWKDALGDNFEEIHEKYLHTIGNLTLTGANSDLSNKSYLEKRDHEYGYLHCNVTMNSYFNDINNWNEDEIIKRANVLTDVALDIWSAAKTTYVPQEDDEVACPLNDEDVTYTYNKVIAVAINEDKYSVNSYRDLVVKFTKAMYEKDKMPLYALADYYDNNDDGKSRVSRDKNKLFVAAEIADDLFIEVHFSAEGSVETMRKIAGAYNMDLSDVIIYLKLNED